MFNAADQREFEKVVRIVAVALLVGGFLGGWAFAACVMR